MTHLWVLLAWGIHAAFAACGSAPDAPCSPAYYTLNSCCYQCLPGTYCPDGINAYTCAAVLNLYQDMSGAPSCKTMRQCPLDTYVAWEGTSSSDRLCVAYTGQCKGPVLTESVAPTRTTDRICSCATGYYGTPPTCLTCNSTMPFCNQCSQSTVRLTDTSATAASCSALLCGATCARFKDAWNCGWFHGQSRCASSFTTLATDMDAGNCNATECSRVSCAKQCYQNTGCGWDFTAWRCVASNLTYKVPSSLLQPNHCVVTAPLQCDVCSPGYELQFGYCVQPSTTPFVVASVDAQETNAPEGSSSSTGLYIGVTMGALSLIVALVLGAKYYRAHRTAAPPPGGGRDSYYNPMYRNPMHTGQSLMYMPPPPPGRLNVPRDLAANTVARQKRISSEPPDILDNQYVQPRATQLPQEPLIYEAIDDIDLPTAAEPIYDLASAKSAEPYLDVAGTPLYTMARPASDNYLDVEGMGRT